MQPAGTWCDVKRVRPELLVGVSSTRGLVSIVFIGYGEGGWRIRACGSLWRDGDARAAVYGVLCGFVCGDVCVDPGQGIVFLQRIFRVMRVACMWHAI